MKFNLGKKKEKKVWVNQVFPAAPSTRCGTTSKGLRTLVDRRKLPVSEEQLLESFRIAPLAHTVILASSFRQQEGAELQVVSCSIAAAESIEYSVRREMPGQPGVPRGRMASGQPGKRGENRSKVNTFKGELLRAELVRSCGDKMDDCRGQDGGQ